MSRKAYYTIIGLFVIIAFIFSVILFPSKEDVAWMLFYKREFGRSARQFQEYFSKNQKTREAIVPRVLIDLEYANVNDAIRIMEDYVNEHPKDIDARIYLGELYQKASRPYAYLRNLEEVYKLRPSIKVLEELKERYQWFNEPEKQMAALKQLVKDNAASARDYSNLAALYAAKGQLNLAVQTFDELLKKFPLEKIDNDIILFAVNIFLVSNMDLKAFLLSSNYASEHPDDVQTIVSLAYKFQQAGDISQANFLANLVAPSRRNNAQYLELMLGLLIQNKDEKTVFWILKTEFEKKRLLVPFYVQLFNLAIFFKEDKFAKEMIETLDFKKVSQNNLVSLINNLISFHNSELAKLLAQKLGPDYLETHKLLSMGLQIAEKGSKEEVEALVEEKGFTNQERLQLAQFLQSSSYQDVAKKLLSEVKSFDGVDVNILPNVAQLYIDLGDVKDLNRLLQSYHLKPGYPREPLNIAQLYVLAAQGNIEELERRFVLKKKLSIDIFQSLYFIAEETKQKKTALKLAQILNRKAPTPDNQMIMARALALNGRPAEALRIIRRLKREGINVTDNYFYTLVLAAQTDKLYRMELLGFLENAVKNPKVTEKKLRNFGYFLIDHKLKEEAYIIFKTLAKGQPFRNSDMQTLIYLWGDHPTDKQVDWMVKEARNSKGADLAGWITFLTYAKHPEEAIQLAEAGDWRSNLKVGLAYLDALQEVKNRSKLEEVLIALLEGKTDFKALEKIGAIAYDLQIYQTAEKAAQKMLAEKPDDPEAIKLIGFIYYDRQEYHPAYRYLKEYNTQYKGEYLSWYFFGNIYWYYRHWDWSRKYFCTALKLLNKEKNLDPYGEMIEAEIYYRLNEFEKSFALFEKVIDKYPRNSSFRVEYADVLINMEKFCRAAYMLAMADLEKESSLAPELRIQDNINLGLSKAQLMVSLNRLRCAWRIVTKLMKLYPDNVQVIMMQAQLEQQLGRWWKAVLWLEQGLRLEPKNEELQVYQRRIFCNRSSFFFGSHEYKLTGTPQTEVISDYTWSHRFNQEYVGKLKFSSDKLTLINSLDVFSGLISDFCGTRSRGEIALERNTQDGLTLEISGFLSEQGLGAGLYFEKPDFYGLSWGRLWYHRQTWDFTETIIDYGVEDRVEFFRSLNLGPRTEIFGQAGYRWYILRDLGEALQTWNLTAGLNYQFSRLNLIRRQFGDEGAVFFNYYVDAQYVTREKGIYSPVLQAVVLPINTVSRETHVWQLSFNKVYCPTFWIEGAGGASYNRISGGPLGPLATFIAHFGSPCGPRLNLSYFHTFSSQFESQSVDRFVADFRIPY